MKVKEQFPETWVERQLRAMDDVCQAACVSPEACAAFMVKAKIVPLSLAKKYGYFAKSDKKKVKNS